MPLLDDHALPAHLSDSDRRQLHALAERNAAAHGEGLLGLVLTGSAGRGMATERSDLDVYVVLDDAPAAGRRADRTAEVDEIPVAISELTDVPAYGTEDWWTRWSFAWAPVLLDRTAGQLAGGIAGACLRQATLSPQEQDAVLFDHDQLDGYVNFAYRALKDHRDGRLLETRLDAAESIPWLLTTVFAMHGRVRPYMKYLPWELRTHPLPGWPAEETCGLLERTLDGDPAAVREAFARVEHDARGYDQRCGASRAVGQIESWGTELGVLG